MYCFCALSISAELKSDAATTWSKKAVIQRESFPVSRLTPKPFGDFMGVSYRECDLNVCITIVKHVYIFLSFDYF